MKHLLLVEDDVSLGETLRERLEKESYQVVWVRTLAAARAAREQSHFDLVILDVGLPDGSGMELAKEIRDSSFLFITAMNTAENRLHGFELGADEFIPKPFHLKELLLRVKRVLQSHPARRSKIKAKGQVIDLDSMLIIDEDGRSRYPAARDFQLLRLLIEQAPRVVSRDEILNSIWGEDKFPSSRTIDNAIVRLRHDLNDPEARIIRSVRGVGYQWAGEVEDE